MNLNFKNCQELEIEQIKSKIIWCKSLLFDTHIYISTYIINLHEIDLLILRVTQRYDIIKFYKIWYIFSIYQIYTLRFNLYRLVHYILYKTTNISTYLKQ